jgi:hypothetical protein
VLGWVSVAPLEEGDGAELCGLTKVVSESSHLYILWDSDNLLDERSCLRVLSFGRSAHQHTSQLVPLDRKNPQFSINLTILVHSFPLKYSNNLYKQPLARRRSEVSQQKEPQTFQCSFSCRQVLSICVQHQNVSELILCSLL